MERKEERARLEYQKPEVKDYGDLRDLTKAATTGAFLDAAFPVNTPFENLTLSD